MPGTIKVLLLAADPREGSGGLRLDQEIREALEAIRMGRAANELEIVAELAVRPDDLHRALLRHSPQIVHFACHGDGERGILLDEGERVRANELSVLFATFREVRAVVLNACDTLPVARALSEVVDYTVAMESAIYDDAAIDFSARFYAALAFGRTVPFAFELARGALEASFGAEHAVPHLLVRPGAGEWPVSEGIRVIETISQVHKFEDVQVGGDAESLSEIQGAGSTSQETDVRRTKVEGSLKLTSSRVK
jgi:hypothetical protein